jgi:hypothetical protein
VKKKLQERFFHFYPNEKENRQSYSNASNGILKNLIRDSNDLLDMLHIIFFNYFFLQICKLI